MREIAEIIDFKITLLYMLMLGLIEHVEIATVYKVVSGFIFIGYNLHRWYSHWQSTKHNHKKHK